MLVFKHKADLRKHLDSKKNEGFKIGLVPTMGALHKGHLSLVLNAASENDLVVVTIFVNPTQFDNPDDLKNYPTALEQDLELLEATGKEIAVFAPSTEEMYADNIRSQAFDFDGLEHQMEGRFRPGHFDGVGTIVKALLELVQADKAYFGEKDFQQLQIIKKLVQKENIATEIVGCPILREEHGLAMSSRNERLAPDLRKEASFIYKTISEAREKFGNQNAQEICEWIENQFSTHPFLKLEYVEIAEESTLKSVKTFQEKESYRLFIAVFANEIRLIDNIALN